MGGGCYGCGWWYQRWIAHQPAGLRTRACGDGCIQAIVTVQSCTRLRPALLVGCHVAVFQARHGGVHLDIDKPVFVKTARHIPPVLVVQQVEPFDQRHAYRRADLQGTGYRVTHGMLKARPGDRFTRAQCDQVRAQGVRIKSPGCAAAGEGGLWVGTPGQCCLGEMESVHAQRGHRLCAPVRVGLMRPALCQSAFAGAGQAGNADEPTALGCGFMQPLPQVGNGVLELRRHARSVSRPETRWCRYAGVMPCGVPGGLNRVH